MAPTWRYWRQRIFRETTHGGSANAILRHFEAMIDKIEMRRSMRFRRNEFLLGLSIEEKSLAFSAAPSPLRSIFKPRVIVAGYMATGSEADPLALLKSAISAGCKAALPFLESKSSPMQFLAWDPNDPLETGPYDIKQPYASKPKLKPDIILVPLIAFDRTLSRLGQGAGHYDRALSLLNDVFIIGVGWAMQEAETLIGDPWDVPMDAILTEKEWICR
jgi:5-formyltetrahydrofolate cyclo-ligase